VFVDKDEDEDEDGESWNDLSGFSISLPSTVLDYP
jgi:hypothetical protein